jgi:nifR3 family TIM-barrel protein
VFVDMLPVESFNRFFCINHHGEFNKRESSRASGIEVANNLNCFNCESAFLKPRLKFMLRRGVREIADIKPRHRRFTSFLDDLLENDGAIALPPVLAAGLKQPAFSSGLRQKEGIEECGQIQCSVTIRLMDAIYRSAVNRDVSPARPGEFFPVAVGPMQIWPPVVLAPMAGVTNFPFRAVCREFGAGLYVSEMINARPLVDGRDKTLKLADFGPNEAPRSLQLYGTDPYYVSEAVKRLVGEGRIDHLDMNFGCPVPKVTRRGGGAAIPLKANLLRNIVRAAVHNAETIPVTLKFRIGISSTHVTFLTAGRIAEEEGCAAVGLHARTAAQLYHGQAEWDAIAELKRNLRIPVFGNGDIWEAEDALRMIRQTGCDGVIVGRGCLGRPWLFRDLADVFNGREPANPPPLDQVLLIMFRHARMLADWFGERMAMRSFRRHASWYTKGFRMTSEVRAQLMRIETVEDLIRLFENVDQTQPFPPSAMRVVRGKTTGVQKKVALPPGFLDNLDDATPLAGADDDTGDGG